MELQTIHVIKYWMQGEFTNFIKVWLSVFASLFYCYFVSKIVPKGLLRFFTILPVLTLNLILPLSLHTLHLGVSSAFFLCWLCNFKLIMFAFGKGPLSDPSLLLSRFLALSCLPIKFQEKDKENPNSKTSRKGLKSIWNYALKGLLIALFLKVYDYNDYIHPKVIWAVYSFHIYFGLEIILAVFGGSARALLGIELEPQFDEPYLSTSLQEFWGRRWNIMVSRILRPTIYDPVLNAMSRIIGRKWAPLPAILGTFMISGIMHELIFFYMGRERPDGGITWFFLLHGVSLMTEVAIKKVINSKWCLPRIISGPLTIGFVLVTSFWLFFPEFLRYNPIERAMDEYAAMGGFVKDVYMALTFKSLNNSTLI